VTTDERIDAIAMHLEVGAGMQIANEKAIAANEKAIATLTERTIQAMDAISRLARIAGCPRKSNFGSRRRHFSQLNLPKPATNPQEFGITPRDGARLVPSHP